MLLRIACGRGRWLSSTQRQTERDTEHTHAHTHYHSLPNQTAIIWQTAMPIKTTSGTMPFVHTRCSDIKPGVLGEGPGRAAHSEPRWLSFHGSSTYDSVSVLAPGRQN